MKVKYLIIGILIGCGLGFAGAKISQKLLNDKPVMHKKNAPLEKEWEWPENLDALKAAPSNHKVVYEDNNVRVLAVILNGKMSEPIHTHKFESVMWIAKPIVPCQINNYKKDKNGNLIKSDSLIIKEMPVDIGQLIDPEGPTSITNLGSDNGVAYRVEFKRKFAK